MWNKFAQNFMSLCLTSPANSEKPACRRYNTYETALSQIGFMIFQTTGSVFVSQGSGAAGGAARGSYNTLIRSIS